MSAGLPALPMCEVCPDPGRCCRKLHLNEVYPDKTSALAFWRESGTPLHALVLMASWGFPFMPVEAHEFEVDGKPARTFSYSCGELRVDGRCGVYEDRPQLCRDYAPGQDAMCVYHVN